MNPDESLGCDGATTFIEGYANNKTHYIKMWEPDETYGIYKIRKVFSGFTWDIPSEPSETEQ